MSSILQSPRKRMMRHFFDSPQFATANVNQISVDIIDNGDSYTINANVPGFMKSEITVDVNASEGFVSIKAERSESEVAEEKEESAPKYLIQQRRQQNLARKIQFDKPLDPSKAKITLNNGVLTLDIPISETAKTVKLSL